MFDAKSFWRSACSYLLPMTTVARTGEFAVDVDPEHEVLCLSGAKEGIAHATMAFADETTVSLVPDIYYPVHGRATGLVGGQTHLLPLRPERGFLPDLS